jgi:hypothetical protein
VSHLLQLQIVQPSPQAALSGSQRIQAMMQQVKSTEALSPADMSQIMQRVQAASPAKVPQSPALSRDSSGRGRRHGHRSPKHGGNAAKHDADALSSPGQSERFEWEVDAKDIICVRLLGSGSFGEVWRGVWLGTPVAVKKVRLLAFMICHMDFVKHNFVFRCASGLRLSLRRNEILGERSTFSAR